MPGEFVGNCGKIGATRENQSFYRLAQRTNRRAAALGKGKGETFVPEAPVHLQLSLVVSCLRQAPDTIIISVSNAPPLDHAVVMGVRLLMTEILLQAFAVRTVRCPS